MKPMETGYILYAHYVALTIGKYFVTDMPRTVVGQKTQTVRNKWDREAMINTLGAVREKRMALKKTVKIYSAWDGSQFSQLLWTSSWCNIFSNGEQILWIDSQ